MHGMIKPHYLYWLEFSTKCHTNIFWNYPKRQCLLIQRKRWIRLHIRKKDFTNREVDVWNSLIVLLDNKQYNSMRGMIGMGNDWKTLEWTSFCLWLQQRDYLHWSKTLVIDIQEQTDACSGYTCICLCFFSYDFICMVYTLYTCRYSARLCILMI